MRREFVTTAEVQSSIAAAGTVGLSGPVMAKAIPAVVQVKTACQKLVSSAQPF